MVIVGMFPDRTDADAAIHDLNALGFTDERIGIAMQGQVEGLLAAALASAANGATGKIGYALTRMRVPEADVPHFESGVQSGRTLIAVNAFTRSDEVLDIMEKRHADFGPSGADRYRPFAYTGEERRQKFDPYYAGPERRMAMVV